MYSHSRLQLPYRPIGRHQRCLCLFHCFCSSWGFDTVNHALLGFIKTEQWSSFTCARGGRSNLQTRGAYLNLGFGQEILRFWKTILSTDLFQSPWIHYISAGVDERLDWFALVLSLAAKESRKNLRRAIHQFSLLDTWARFCASALDLVSLSDMEACKRGIGISASVGGPNVWRHF